MKSFLLVLVLILEFCIVANAKNVWLKEINKKGLKQKGNKKFRLRVPADRKPKNITDYEVEIFTKVLRELTNRLENEATFQEKSTENSKKAKLDCTKLKLDFDSKNEGVIIPVTQEDLTVQSLLYEEIGFWSRCTRTCKSRRARKCRLPGLCSVDFYVEEAHCYAPGSKCEEKVMKKLKIEKTESEIDSSVEESESEYTLGDDVAPDDQDDHNAHEHDGDYDDHEHRYHDHEDHYHDHDEEYHHEYNSEHHSHEHIDDNHYDHHEYHSKHDQDYFNGHTHDYESDHEPDHYHDHHHDHDHNDVDDEFVFFTDYPVFEMDYPSYSYGDPDMDYHMEEEDDPESNFEEQYNSDEENDLEGHVDPKKVEMDEAVCGKSQVSVPYESFRIIGGREAMKGVWPWQVAIVDRYGSIFCGGTIIAGRWVLTAAHCLRRKISVRIADHDLSRYDGEHKIRVQRAIRHPDYDLETIDSDIALLQLKKNVFASVKKNVRKACLPPYKSEPEVSKSCVILGWGKERETHIFGSDVLMMAKVPIVSTKKCQRAYDDHQMTDNMLCAGYMKGGPDACDGDSGGPLLCRNDDKKWVLEGITSFGDGCGERGKIGVYVNVANYIKWINETISKYD